MKPLNLDAEQEANRACIRRLCERAKPDHYGVYLTETGAVVGVLNPDDKHPSCVYGWRVLDKVYL